MAPIDAEHWWAEVHRDIDSNAWRPHKGASSGYELDLLSGSLVNASPDATSTPRTRDECSKLLEGLILPSLGEVKLRYLDADHVRRWYSTVLSADRPTQRKHAYALLR